MIAGANKDDYHLRNVTPGEDFSPNTSTCARWPRAIPARIAAAPLEVFKTIEIGHIFKLGYKYSESMGLRVLGEDGKEITPIMGSYGIGIERILTCAVELFTTKTACRCPPAIAPFTVVITPVNYADAAQREAAELLYDECAQSRHRRAAGRSRRTPRREVQRCRSDRHSLSASRLGRSCRLVRWSSWSAADEDISRM